MSTEPFTPLRQRPPGSVGRARDAGRDTRILEAVLDLISEQGPSAINMEAVAARAGVGKSTVYRRWGNLTDLLADAVDAITFPDTLLASAGNLRDDLVDGIISASGCMDPRRQRILGALLNTGDDQTELVEALRARFNHAIAAALATAVDASRQRNRSTQHELPGPASSEAESPHLGEAIDPSWPDASIDLAVVIGLLTTLPQTTGRSLDRNDFEDIVDDVLLPLWANRGLR